MAHVPTPRPNEPLFTLRPSWIEVGRTANTVYYAHDDDVLIVVPQPGSHDDGATARENVSFQMGHARQLGRRIATVVLLGRLVAQDADARRAYADGMNPELCFGSALVVTNPLSRAIGSFFLGLSKPRIPTKMVESVDQAVAWLDTLRGSGAAR
ncbi:MAG: hypothetical protein U0230_01370 [Polyangiales bacterium]